MSDQFVSPRGGEIERPPKGAFLPDVLRQEGNLDVIFPGFQTWSDSVLLKSLAFDRQSQLWGCGLGGVIRWVIAAHEITYKIWHSEHGLAGNDTTCLLITPDDHILCGHRSGWFSLFDHERWTTFDSGRNYSIKALGLGPDGNPLACTEGGIYNITTHEFVPTPEPPLSVITAFGWLWIGTESGLYRWVDEAWVPLPAPRPTRALNALRADERRLWFGGLDGAGYVDENGAFTFVELDGIAYQIALYGEQAFFGTDMGLYMHQLGDGGVRRVANQQTHLVVVNARERVFGTAEHLFYFSHAKVRSMLPTQKGRPAEIRRVFTDRQTVWIQCVDGSIWRTDGDGWRQITSATSAPMSGVATIQGQPLVAFNAAQGVMALINYRLVAIPRHSLAYVIGLLTYNESVWLLTAHELIHVTADGTWEAIPTGDQLGSLRCIAPDFLTGKVRIVTAQGIYVPENGEIVQQFEFETVMRAATFDAITGDLFCSDGRSITQVVGLSFNPLPLPPGLNRVTSLAVMDGILYAGTLSGLWKLTYNTERHDQINSALANSAVIELFIVYGQLWVLTADGVTVIDGHL